MSNTNRLRVLRAERRINQWDTAKLAGITENRYWRIENGRADALPAERKALAKVFGVKISDVFPPASQVA